VAEVPSYSARDRGSEPPCRQASPTVELSGRSIRGRRPRLLPDRRGSARFERKDNLTVGRARLNGPRVPAMASEGQAHGRTARTIWPGCDPDHWTAGRAGIRTIGRPVKTPHVAVHHEPGTATRALTCRDVASGGAACGRRCGYAHGRCPRITTVPSGPGFSPPRSCCWAPAPAPTPSSGASILPPHALPRVSSRAHTRRSRRCWWTSTRDVDPITWTVDACAPRRRWGRLPRPGSPSSGSPAPRGRPAARAA
jgi:hypothetical protein